jgi:hypothetical protein
MAVGGRPIIKSDGLESANLRSLPFNRLPGGLPDGFFGGFLGHRYLPDAAEQMGDAGRRGKSFMVL